MSTIQVEIINPKAEQLLRDLEELNLISITKTKENKFTSLLQKLRGNQPSLTIEEITQEVEEVREKRHVKSN